jgi:hypothetical protein
MSANVGAIDVPGWMVGTWKIDTATTEINRNDFGVSYHGAIPGGKTLADKVQIVLEVAADLVVNV